MSSVTATSALRGASLRGATLPRWAPAATIVGSAAFCLLLFAITPLRGTADYIAVAVLVTLVAITGLSWAVEGRRKAVDRIATSGTLLALLLTLLPLGFVIGYVTDRGAKRFSGHFLTSSMSGVGPLDAGGGISQAIIGTLEQVLIASVIAVPLGLMVAIYITEYGGSRFSNAVRFLIDVMTGIPSIVAGLFVLAFWLIELGHGFSGLAGALALSILELPIVVRTSEQMIQLVPNALREASYALGIPKWRTIMRVVLPTASTGIVTGIMLAIARVIGETAPVLLVIGNNNFVNSNAFHGAQASIGVFIYQGALSSSNFDVDRAWAAALTLILIVLVLYIAARLLTRRSKLGGR
ncbi:MAG TPA: phosphate ABC transporter permease PstA [Mycobacteriales bacterium]|nr:phosphate ABC transporter permease PstA [Mycobacteriales bacterium]